MPSYRVVLFKGHYWDRSSVLFTIFVDDVDLHIDNSLIIKYADDVKLVRAFSKITLPDNGTSNLLQEDLNNLFLWSQRNGLRLNTAKCKSCHFGRSNPSHQYHLSNVPISQTSVVNDLGVLLSQPLHFKEHVSSVVLRANRMLGMLKKSFRTRDPKTILILYKAFVRPVLEYGSILWNPYQRNLIDRIEGVQRRLCRFFTQLEGLNYRSKLTNLNLLSLNARRLRYGLLFLFKILNNETGLNPDN